MTITYAAIAERTGTTIPTHLEAQATPPLLVHAEGLPAHQGDVWMAPHNGGVPAGRLIVLAGEGHKVVQGEADRNSHILNGDGHFVECRIKSDLDYGVLVVPFGGEAVLTHTAEHGSIRLGEGEWRLWGQLDAATQRRAAD